MNLSSMLDVLSPVLKVSQCVLESRAAEVGDQQLGEHMVRESVGPDLTRSPRQASQHHPSQHLCQSLCKAGASQKTQRQEAGQGWIETK